MSCFQSKSLLADYEVGIKENDLNLLTVDGYAVECL